MIALLVLFAALYVPFRAIRSARDSWWVAISPAAIIVAFGALVHLIPEP